MSVIPKERIPVENQALFCPELSEIVQGLGGKPRLIEVGGVPYLLPTVKRDRLYDMRYFGQLAGMSEKAFLVGAGAGPWPHAGTNCEMIVNLELTGEEPAKNETWIAKVAGEDEHCVAEQLPKQETRGALLGNLYCSEGAPGKVLEIECKKRIKDDDFIASIRKTLAEHYKEKPVGLGGVFLMKEGKAKQHVMRDFSKEPINSDEEVNEWLKFFDMSAPLVAVGTLVSADPGLDLRVQHFHSFSHHGEAGHYHIDTQPDSAHYLAYLGLAEHIYRLDRPVETHQFGRD
ncbi:hypothetical protein B566_EDAN001810 [Ephemera danica]|nr:hypothetical protein B566_EDAN001810 [Ephemera danica]